MVSLDGRISKIDPITGQSYPPPAITHERDWRLYLELAAQSDAVVTSGRRLRQMAKRAAADMRCIEQTGHTDLIEWRRQYRLPPHPACIVLTASLDLPFTELREREHGNIILMSPVQPTADQTQAIKSADLDLVTVDNARVTGDDIRRLAMKRGFATIYSIGGPEVLSALVAAKLLNRLYLSFALCLLAGRQFHTILSGENLTPPFDFDLHELYLDPPAADKPGYLFATLDRRA
ncbi:MAG: dihydrofolate reductase family protein [Gammaproteobacteria bacterium]|nr:dihydrofolate reductase family protein [Gammaproteobacteria bacterium]